MKRILVLLAASTCLIFWCACGSSDVKELAEKISEDATNSEVETSTEILAKPAYASKTIEELSSLFSSTQVLSDSKFEKILPLWKKLVTLSKEKSLDLGNPDETAMKEFEKTMGEFGFEDWNELRRSLEVTSTCMMLLPMFEEMEKIEDDLAYKMARELSSTLITQGQISKQDLKYVHDHWDEATNILNSMEAE